MHIAIDGFVAGPNSEMDWIIADDEIFDYAGDRTQLKLVKTHAFSNME